VAIESDNTTILVIDDNPTNLGVLYGALSSTGHDILVEMDGRSGLTQAQKNPPDLILLDVMMPGIDGFETCRLLKADPSLREIPVIFMTALSDAVDKVKGLKLGAVDYITKPFQQDEVVARIDVHLQLRKMRLELARQNEKLEQKVQERTAKLSKALDDLREAQTQLVQTEKMSSLGQLVAGVAHEINNPVNFIHGNLEHISDYAQNLLELICLYQQRCPSNDPEIQEFLEELDLEFVVDDVPKTLSSMKLGVDRIRQIVKSLRNFSRLDEAIMKPVNIHDGIDSTLLILQHRLKARAGKLPIEVFKDYGNLPNIECYAGQLNQVLMNIINNAIDALQEKEDWQSSNSALSNSVDRTPSSISIRTQAVSPDWIRIVIEDNGLGIDEANKAKIFDPFFTTKPVGKGTGLGLSIGYKIVTEKHGGRLTCVSEPGSGTVFSIELPIKQTVTQTPKLFSISDRAGETHLSESRSNRPPMGDTLNNKVVYFPKSL